MSTQRGTKNRAGLIAALFSPLFLGMNPIFGKLAYQNGADPFTVAALRTVIAVALLWLLYYIFWRKFLYIYPVGLMNCVAIGAVNGIGSLMYYNGLNLLDASVAQLINSMYLVFVVILTRISGQRIGWRTLLRVGIAVTGIFLITGAMQGGQSSWLGVGLMMGNALLFAGTVVMSQRALYDMPAQTVAFYVLATMAIVVSMARLAYDLPVFTVSDSETSLAAFWAILGLASTTAISRLLMFFGVKGLGSLQTTLLTILEIAASMTMAFLLLSESLNDIQWIGVLVLSISLLMPTESITPKDASPTDYLPHIVRVQLWRMAFTHAFSNEKKDKFKTQELDVIQKMFQQDKFSTQELLAIHELENKKKQEDESSPCPGN